jgi:hypothetical protein
MLALLVVIAVLLLCLVLANDAARAWLVWLVCVSTWLAIALAVLAASAVAVLLIVSFWEYSQIILAIALVGVGLWRADPGRHPLCTRLDELTGRGIDEPDA